MIVGATLLAVGVIIGTAISVAAIMTSLPDTIIVRSQACEDETLNISAPNPVELIGEGEHFQEGQPGDGLSDPNDRRRP